mgnify:CR=1 FL=1
MCRSIICGAAFMMLVPLFGWSQNGDTISSWVVDEKTIYTESDVRTLNGYHVVLEPQRGCWGGPCAISQRSYRFGFLSAGGQADLFRSDEIATLGLGMAWNKSGIFTELEFGMQPSLEGNLVSLHVSKYLFYIPHRFWSLPLLRCGGSVGVKDFMGENRAFVGGEVAVPFFLMNGHVYCRSSIAFGNEDVVNAQFHELGLKFYLFMVKKPMH